MDSFGQKMGKHSYIKYALPIILLVYILIETRAHQDFDIFLLASKDFLQGGNIFVHHYESGFRFFYSPLFAAILIPFTFLPIYLARIIWLTLNVLAFARCFKLIKSYLNFNSFSEKQKWLFDFISMVFSAKLILDNFHNGQVTIFMLLFMLEGLRLINANKAFWGAALIALGINFKFLPLVLLPYLFYNKQLKACVFIVCWYVVFLFLPALVCGFEFNNTLLKDWLLAINPSNTQHLIDTDETTLNGLTTLIPTLLMDTVPDPHALIYKRNILNLDITTVITIITITRLLLLCFVFYFLRRKPFTPPQNKLHTLWELSYVFLLIPLLFPHQQHYAFFMMMPASMYVIYWLFISKAVAFKLDGRFLSILILIYILTNAHLLVGEFRQYYDHYKIITYGGLLMIVLLACLKPDNALKEI
ncbi:MAG: glycosyltransferase family 87 protein [Bacteroidia bacterium]